MLFTVLYFEFLISGYLSTTAPKESFEDKAGYKVPGVVFLIVTLFVLPTLYIVVLQRDLIKLQESRFKSRLGELYAGLKTKEKISVAFYMFYCVRRCLYLLIAETLLEKPAIQVVLMISLNQVMLAYQGFFGP